MKAPLSWLRDYVPLDAPVERLAELLSELGLVVDGVERIGEGLEKVVVARVLNIRPHPNADRIRLVDVDPGDGGPLQIVCGAWNFAEGDLVPLAPVGAVLPGGFAITARKMRGELSKGMLCSATELNLPPAAGAEDGLLILEPDLAPPGVPLGEALGLETDVVFDLDITPNRPDALSMAGVARDLAAVLGETWRLPAGPAPVPVDESLGTAVLTVSSGDLCPRFTATLLEGVPHGPSPAWMARRLTLAGMRPINVVVDVSNYVMLDVGQPNHAYDLARLGGGGILVRRAVPGEVVETLDGTARVLEGDDCVICDADGEPVGVAGIMGGARAEIVAGTARVLLEAAYFNPMAIARTGKRLGLHSEARVRFERGVDADLAGLAVERFVSLLAAAGGGEGLRRGPTVDVVDSGSKPVAPLVRLRTERVNRLLGTSLETAQVPSLLGPIGFECDQEAPGIFAVAVPSWRIECNREVDLVEEVARMWGYHRIERTLPSGGHGGGSGLDRRQTQRRQVRQILAGTGFLEAWTTTFLAPGDLERTGLDPAAVEVENPLDRSESLLRTALLPGLLKAARHNQDRQAEGVNLFEIGRVFAPPPDGGGLPVEEELLGVIVADPSGAEPSSGERAVGAVVRTWAWLAASLRLAGCELVAAPGAPGWHPGRVAHIQGSGGSALGTVGEVDPDVVAGYGLTGRVGHLTVSLDGMVDEGRRPWLAREVSRYPASDVDLAFVVDEGVAATAVRTSLIAAGGDLLESAVLFDVFRGAQLGEGRRSLAFRLRFRAVDRTLTDAELASLRQATIDRVIKDHRATLRG